MRGQQWPTRIIRLLRNPLWSRHHFHEHHAVKRIFAIISLAFLIDVTAWPSVFGKNAPTSNSQLLQEFETALKTKDKDAILSLYNWEGVSDWMKAGQSQMIDDWLTREVKSVKLSPLPANFSSSGENGNIRFHLNVQPAGIIEAGFTDGFGVAFPFGSKGDAYYIAGIITEKIPYPGGGTNKLLTIRVQTPSGKPLPGIMVVGATPETIPTLHFFTLYGGDAQFLTDDQGQFNLPVTDTNLFLVAADDQGFGWLQNHDPTNDAVMVIQPWGRIEGIRKNRNHVVTDERLSLSLDRDYCGEDVVAPIRYSGHVTSTDAQGRFIFEQVPPLRLFIDRQEKQRGYWGYF